MTDAHLGHLLPRRRQLRRRRRLVAPRAPARARARQAGAPLARRPHRAREAAARDRSRATTCSAGGRGGRAHRASLSTLEMSRTSSWRPSAAIRRRRTCRRWRRASRRPRWINLEYLSAEEWVEGSHALPSPQPAPAAREAFLLSRLHARAPAGCCARRACCAGATSSRPTPARRRRSGDASSGKAPPRGALKVSLFSYAGAPFEGARARLRASPRPRLARRARRGGRHGARDCAPAHRIRRNDRTAASRREVEVLVVPFLPQDRYDQLLWACDVNFVRGEDSFVRAQWAGRPFVWHIYPTDDGAHWVKLAAFLRAIPALDRARAAAGDGLWEAWNRRPDEATHRHGWAREARVAGRHGPVSRLGSRCCWPMRSGGRRTGGKGAISPPSLSISSITRYH